MTDGGWTGVAGWVASAWWTGPLSRYTLYRVKKTSLYLDPELDERLAQRAAQDGISKAEFIRRGLEGLVTRPKRPKPSVAVFEGDDVGYTVSENVDRYLRETGFGRD